MYTKPSPAFSTLKVDLSAGVSVVEVGGDEDDEAIPKGHKWKRRQYDDVSHHRQITRTFKKHSINMSSI